MILHACWGPGNNPRWLFFGGFGLLFYILLRGGVLGDGPH